MCPPLIAADTVRIVRSDTTATTATMIVEDITDVMKAAVINASAPAAVVMSIAVSALVVIAEVAIDANFQSPVW